METLKSSKSVIRSIRIGEALDKSLQQESRARRMSINAFLSSILEKYDEWDRVAEKFSFVTLSTETLREFLKLSDEEGIAKSARELGRRLPKEIMLFWFGGISPDVFISYVSMLSRYQKYFEYQITQTGRTITLTAHHNTGTKWSIWLMNFLDQAIRSTLGVVPSSSYDSNTVKITYQAP